MKWTLKNGIYDLKFSRGDLKDICHGITLSCKTKNGDLIIISRE